MTPQRITLSRAKGWRMPSNTVVVARPSKWGNPFRVGDRVQVDPTGPVAVCFSQAEAVQAFRDLIMTPMLADFRAEVVAELRGKNLACWCKPGDTCHADVLLELANR